MQQIYRRTLYRSLISMKLQTMASTKKYGFRFNFSKTYWLPLEVFQKKKKKKKSNTFNPFTFQKIASKILFQVFPYILINFLFFFKICKWPIFQWQLLIKVSMFSKNKPSHCFQGVFFRVSFYFKKASLGINNWGLAFLLYKLFY